MKYHLDEQCRLVLTVSKKVQQSLRAAQHRDEQGLCDPAFDSDDFTHDLLEAMTANDEFVWIPAGCTDDLTSAPMLGVLGEELPGPDDPQDAIGMGLVHVGRWTHEGRLRQMYQPVLRRWAYMSYQITSPQQELAETGVCSWDGGDLWGSQEAAVLALAKLLGEQIGSQA